MQDQGRQNETPEHERCFREALILLYHACHGSRHIRTTDTYNPFIASASRGTADVERNHARRVKPEGCLAGSVNHRHYLGSVVDNACFSRVLYLAHAAWSSFGLVCDGYAPSCLSQHMDNLGFIAKETSSNGSAGRETRSRGTSRWIMDLSSRCME